MDIGKIVLKEIGQFLTSETRSTTDMKHIGVDLYCAHVRVSDRVVPGIEDFYYHVSKSDGLVAKYHESYPDSTYEGESPAPYCPGCGKR